MVPNGHIKLPELLTSHIKQLSGIKVTLGLMMVEVSLDIFKNKLFEQIKLHYYAPPSRPEGPRRCADRGNAGSALVSIYLFWLLYAMGVYT